MHLDSVFANIAVEKRCFCGYEAAELDALMAKTGGNGPYPKGAGGAGCTSA
jgi:hypothetical protein